MSALKALARRIGRFLLWPVRRLLEPRFGGVHQNIDFSREKVREDIDIYATSSLESLAYVGDRLEAIDARLGRIERGRDGAGTGLELADLDPGLAGVLNDEVGPNGFAAQAGLWFNPPLWLSYREGGVEIKAVNERIAEIPFAIGAVSRIELPARILDIGSSESTLPLSLATLGYDVTAVDPRPIPYRHPRLEAVESSFEELQAEPGSFDAVTCISTIEHFGVGAYGEQGGDNGADRAAVERIRPLLAEGGFLVLTVPFGEPRPGPEQRVYDDESLAALLAGWELRVRTTVTRVDARTWVRAEREDAGAGGGESAALIIALPE